MNHEQGKFRFWPPLTFGAGLVLVPTLLETWMSKPVAWSIGFFVWSALFYAVENRFNVFHANFAKYLIGLAVLSLIVSAVMR